MDNSGSGGHLWVYLNWALGLQALGCNVIWLEDVHPRTPPDKVRRWVADLKQQLEPYGLAHSVAIASMSGAPLARSLTEGCLALDDAAAADLLLNLRYRTPPEVVAQFRRSALVDIDPGLLQTWVSNGQVRLARHDVYFSIGEVVGTPAACFPDLGLRWEYTPPCVALDRWPRCEPTLSAPFTTVAHWFAGGWTGEAGHLDDKRSGFLRLVDLPRRTSQVLELALDLQEDDDDRKLLQEHGWRLRDARQIGATPWDYQRYIQGSLGEFSCAKPAYLRLQPGWISDRTVCYLASGKPAVVQHTGPSQFLPDAEGLFRFKDPDGAMRALAMAAADYPRQSRAARALAERHFDAKKVVSRVLERALA